MKKLLALLLVVVMVMCIFAGCNKPDDPSDPTGTQGTTPTGSTPTEPEYVPMTGEAGRYTYNAAWSTFPTLWNPHTYETATSADIMAYLEDGFYGFDYNEDMTGFQMVPSMVVDDHPIDITSEYIGQYGIEEGDTARVYKIVLRDDLKWETGEAITAHDYVESAKRLLNPAAQNYRADTMYTGDVVIWGTENYLKQGTYAYSNMVSAAYGADEYVLIADFTVKEDGTFAVDGVGDVWFNINDGGNWGSNSMKDYYDYGYFNDNAKNLWETVIVPAANEAGYVAVNAEVANALCDIVACLHGAADAAEYAASAGDYAYQEWEEMCFYGADKPEYSWDDVGIFALSDTELVYVLTKPMSGFYLKYGLPSGYLVHIATYDKCESLVDGVYTNTYGTSAETSVSYGPYKLVEYQTDKVFKFEKNEHYFDLTDDTYMTTHIEIQKIDEAATRLNMLIAGQLDAYGLQASDYEIYSMSDYCYYSKGASTYAMVFNPDLETLTTTQTAAGENINKTILTVSEFRQAMAYGLNRSEFILATSPAGSPAFGLFSDLHIVDPETGVGYRTTELAKQVLADFWGVSGDIGEGKLYENLDDAVDSLTGYNPELAKVKFNEAYDKAIAEGLMDADDVIEIVIGLPSTSPVYTNGYEFIVNNYTELVKGTKLEGKLTFKKDDTIGDNFAGSLQDNQTDMLFYVGWSGMELNPYGLMQAYVAPSYQYDSHYDFSQIDLTIEIDGKALTTDMISWYEIMNGVPHTVYDAEGNGIEFSCGTNDNDPETRLLILGKMEGAVLMNYNFIPLSGAASAALKGAQLKYYTEEYIYGMGFGGIKYMTYHYDDAQWAEYVNSLEGKLDYT